MCDAVLFAIIVPFVVPVTIRASISELCSRRHKYEFNRSYNI